MPSEVVPMGISTLQGRHTRYVIDAHLNPSNGVKAGLETVAQRHMEVRSSRPSIANEPLESVPSMSFRRSQLLLFEKVGAPYTLLNFACGGAQKRISCWLLGSVICSKHARLLTCSSFWPILAISLAISFPSVVPKCSSMLISGSVCFSRWDFALGARSWASAAAVLIPPRAQPLATNYQQAFHAV
jgi:hypothetical protein